jgi:hypothetical protein
MSGNGKAPQLKKSYKIFSIRAPIVIKLVIRKGTVNYNKYETKEVQLSTVLFSPKVNWSRPRTKGSLLKKRRANS